MGFDGQSMFRADSFIIGHQNSHNVWFGNQSVSFHFICSALDNSTTFVTTLANIFD
jgi:hypothetical protein